MTSFAKLDQKKTDLINELAQDLHKQFLKEGKPEMVQYICFIICRTLKPHHLISADDVRRVLGDQYKDALERNRGR